MLASSAACSSEPVDSGVGALQSSADDAGVARERDGREPADTPRSEGCSAACAAVEACCGGRCVDLSSDAAHCGACDVACGGQQATSACVEGECTIQACTEGFVDCNGRAADGCEVLEAGLPGTPRLVSPMQGEYTGSVHAESSRIPRLRWSAPASTGTCGTLRYELQLDDSCERTNVSACSFPSPEATATDVEETSWVPGEPLSASTTVPVGATYFWRVRACESAGRCSAWSEVRYLNVGRLRDDLNGDGYSEVIALSNHGESRVHTLVVPGGPTIASNAMVPFEAPLDIFGDVRFVGDVNGDGFMDAVCAQDDAGRYANAVPPVSYLGAGLLLGGPVLSELSFVQLPERVANLSVAGLGDWNADGFDDFAVAVASFSAESTAESSLRVYPGGVSFDAERAVDIAVPPTTTPVEFGNNLEGAFDLDADGYSDLAIMDGDDGRIHIVRGGPAASAVIGLSLSTGVPCYYYQGARLARAGDMNGDGIAELAARCGNRVLVYAGGRTPALEPVWETLVGELVSAYTQDIVGGFDLGQDGLADLVYSRHAATGEPFSLASTVTPMILAGSPELGRASQPVPFGGPATTPAFNGGMTIGDYDGDGRKDVILPSVVTESNGLRSYVLRRFSGEPVASSNEPCAQPSSSFESVGNWCNAPYEDIRDTYVAPGGGEQSVGDSFGYLLGR